MEDFLWGLWNGLTAWPLLIIHAFGGWHRFPVYDVMRDGGWYQFAFLLGSGSPFLGLLGRNKTVVIADRRQCGSAHDPPAPPTPAQELRSPPGDGSVAHQS